MFFRSGVPLACLFAPAPARWTLSLVFWSAKCLLSHLKLWMPRSTVVVPTIPSFRLWLMPLVWRSGRLVWLVHLFLHVEVVLHVPVTVEGHALRAASWVPVSAAPHPFTSSSSSSLICRSRADMIQGFLVSLPTVSWPSIRPIVIHAAPIPPWVIPLPFVLTSS